MIELLKLAAAFSAGVMAFSAAMFVWLVLTEFISVRQSQKQQLWAFRLFTIVGAVTAIYGYWFIDVSVRL